MRAKSNIADNLGQGFLNRRGLPRRELQVLALAADGHTDKEIARTLGISTETVNTYWRRIRTRFGTSSRTEVVAIAMRENAEAHFELLNEERTRLLHSLEDQRIAAERARTNESRMRSLLDQLPLAAFRARPDGTLLFANRRFFDFFALEDVRGRQPRALPKELASLLDAAARDVSPEQAAYDADIRTRLGDRQVQMHWSLRGVFGSRRQLEEVLGFGYVEREIGLTDPSMLLRLQFDENCLEMAGQLLKADPNDLGKLSGRFLESLLQVFSLDRIFALELDPADHTLLSVNSAIRRGQPKVKTDALLGRSDVLGQLLSLVRTDRPLTSSGAPTPDPFFAGRPIAQATCLVIDSINGPRVVVVAERAEREREWTAEDDQMLRRAAILLAGAKVRRHVKAELSEVAETRSRLLRLARTLVVPHSHDDLLLLMRRTLSEIVAFDTLGIYELDQGRGVLVPSSFETRQAGWERLQTFEIGLGEGIIGRCALSGKSELVNNAHLDPRALWPEPIRPRQEHLMVHVLQGFVGPSFVIAIGRSGPRKFTQSEFETVAMFASLVHVSLQLQGQAPPEPLPSEASPVGLPPSPKPGP